MSRVQKNVALSQDFLSGDKLEDTESRYRNVCNQVTGVFITLYNSYHAGTTADLWMSIRQGSIECTTHRPTWDAPDEGDDQVTHWRWGQQGCANTFDNTKKIDVFLNSDSSNDVYVTKMGVRLGAIYIKTWHTSGSYTFIDSDENNGWYTTTS